MRDDRLLFPGGQGGEPLVFAREDDAAVADRERWKLLVVDDEREVHALTRLVLGDFLFDGVGLEFLHAYSAAEARGVLEQNGDVAVILLDVVMETPDAGLVLTQWIREELGNPFVRIVLRTGQPGEAPEKRVLLEYEINDYKYKTELTDERLFASLTTAVRSYRHLRELERSRAELEVERDRAESARLARDQFLANMSHELRTPLNGILGLTNLLMEKMVAGEDMEYCRMIRKSGEGLLAILNNALEMSSIREGTLVLEERPFRLRTEIARTMDVMQIQAGWKSLELHWNVDPRVPERLIGDAARLRQILVNMLVNAIRFTERGAVTLSVFLLDENFAATIGDRTPSPRDEDEIALFFVVSDTGIGIPADRLESIFEPFSLGEDYMTKRLSGAGLGLAISRDIIQRMNGCIWVESEPTEGSQFYFSLCFRVAEPMAG
ncbi:signal transduction histidine kinase [Desulfobaculum xiamenense]|uniref:histidine kinase n=1 Tax=Desulfobaculum xiamenense TaxID=995050 RepID=A0A846QDR6_9BACT|nr:ATP-binding protein [Desulfobaculum xiamenense]NJB66518.1 signal transduction histidine kinase [Desulfobaculum xiamenense]